MKTILPPANAPTNFPSGDRRTYRVTGISLLTSAPAAPKPAAVLVDRDGEVWRPTDRVRGGERVWECPAPSDPEDRGDGPSYPWTLPEMNAWFGPLVQQRLDGAA
ncbi:hypothetical protein OG292_19040 [Streptomyces sp. NBC_01511]|uniref:hypothetical protein n=1 Tax=Streptomyces sp. NBC_01511 TaxID=2903889 RepID=UPI0038690699